MIQLENKLYTSTEVADILGVSLRSVYRYIEENKLNPEVKTATGRHRFTKQNIIDFLYPNGNEEDINVKDKKEEKVKNEKKTKIEMEEEKEIKEEVEIKKEKEEKKETKIKEKEEKEDKKEEKIEIIEEEKKEEPIDWLAKFRQAAKRFEEESISEEVGKKEEEETISIKEKQVQNKYYYRSKLGGLKDIAQNIDKSSKNSGSDYAFTMNAGLSLHSPIKPFSILHAYIRTKDREFFERVLMLTPSDEENAQLCLILSDNTSIYSSSMQMHGLTVVSKEKLLSDIREMDTEGSLIREAESVLA